MRVASGTRLGPYEIVGFLGAGGMGEVYRARDLRLSREVAVKILPPPFAKDADRLRRFEQEARAAGVLNHPNILAVYDIGSHDGTPYVVSELLEGHTLRELILISGIRLSPRKTIDYGLQIARGLAAAHEKGIVHRDLKPENLFITKDGRVKILDFGLARLTHSDDTRSEQSDLPTNTAGTAPGTVLGTLRYMSPEQARGLIADPRSDIFAFGAVVYEMLSGSPAFSSDSAADTLTAILTKEPPPLSVSNPDIPGALERIVGHCLEKNPDQRFQSARDLAFDLEAFSTASGPAAALAGRKRVVSKRLALAAVVVALCAAFYAVGARFGAPVATPPEYQQATFHRGFLEAARFAPDGQTIVYSAAWGGGPREIYAKLMGNPESRSLGVSGAVLLAVSRSGEMAIALGNVFRPSLARMSISGRTAPKTLRDILGPVSADWTPDGKELALAHLDPSSRRHRLEFPIGKVLYVSDGYVSDVRFSAKGDVIAFVDHPVRTTNSGRMAIVDRQGHSKVLTANFDYVLGLAWQPDGSEIWFAGAPVGGTPAFYGVTMDGRTRLVARVPGEIVLHDIGRDGRALLSMEMSRQGMRALAPGAEQERDLSWLETSLLTDISPDGRMVAFTEWGAGGEGQVPFVYVRPTDGRAATRLGEGYLAAFSPDGKWVLGLQETTSGQRIAIYPVGPGEPRFLPLGGLHAEGASWCPDGERIVFFGFEGGHGRRLYVINSVEGKPRAISPEGHTGSDVFTRDGKATLGYDAERRIWVYPLDGENPSPLPLPPLEQQSNVVSWGRDGQLLVITQRPPFLEVRRLDPRTGRKQPWKMIAPPDTTGITNVQYFAITPDWSAYAYGYLWRQSDLFVAEGLR